MNFLKQNRKFLKVNFWYDNNDSSIPNASKNKYERKNHDWLRMHEERIRRKNIDVYVESYLEISDQLENLQDERLDGNLEERKYNQILDMYDYLTESITRYFIKTEYKNFM